MQLMHICTETMTRECAEAYKRAPPLIGSPLSNALGAKGPKLPQTVDAQCAGWTPVPHPLAQDCGCGSLFPTLELMPSIALECSNTMHSNLTMWPITLRHKDSHDSHSTPIAMSMSTYSLTDYPTHLFIYLSTYSQPL